MDLVTYLCHHGADVNAITCEGATPMHWASFKGYYECVKYLIEKTSASPLAVTNAGFTALHYACSSESGEAGNIHIAKILYDYGVPIDCINEVLKFSDLMIHELVGWGHTTAFCFLCRKSDDDEIFD